MATEIELAALAYRVYGQSEKNLIEMLEWPENLALRRSTSSGFAASVYTKGSEVVIAFRGTDFDALADGIADFWNGNIPAARGSYSDQVMDAIKLVADAIDIYGKDNITFTGHSLGGGLASLMATFFDLPAVVFDPAPFALTALSEVIPIVPGAVPVPIPVPVWSTVLSQYQQDYIDYQSSRGGRATDADFMAYANTFGILSGNSAETRNALFADRAANVTGRYLQGEVVAAALSIPSAQVVDVMALYLQTKQQYPLANISFTGHSLGGGLASLMAVWNATDDFDLRRAA